MKDIVKALKLVSISLKYYYLNPRISDSVVRRWAKEVCERFGVEVVCDGWFDSDKFLILANHQSYFDVIALYVCCNKRLIWVAKEELFNIPIVGHALRDLEGVAVDRLDDMKSARAILKLMKSFDNGGIVIFPQGTRKDRDTFHMGGIFLAKKKQLPIYPVKITGSDKVMPVGKFTVNPGTVRVKVFEKIESSEFTEEEIKEMVREKILW